MPPRFLERDLHLPALEMNQARICAGVTAGSVHRSAWGAKCPCGSRISTQHNGTGGSPL
jgi:hypothetical protein